MLQPDHIPKRALIRRGRACEVFCVMLSLSFVLTSGCGAESSDTCVIDMGSNSFKRIVGRHEEGRYVERSMVKRTLGVGDDLTRHGRISESKLEEIERTLEEFRADCRAEGVVRILAIGTAAFRDAPNGEQVVAVAARLGIPMEIASEARESELAYLVGSLGRPGFAVIDNGSRSIELAAKAADGRFSYSAFNLGYRVGWTEYFSAAEDPSLAIAAFRDRLRQEAGGATFMRQKDRLVGVEFEEMAEVFFPAAEIEGRGFTRDQLEERIEQIESSGVAGFRTLKLQEDIDRALPRLVAAATLLEMFDYPSIELTARELGTGLIIEQGLRAAP